MAVDIQIRSNIDKLRQWLDQLPRHINSRVLDPAKRDVGLLVQRTSRRLAPKDLGDLENSIDYRVHSRGVTMEVPDNSKAGDYAKIQHDKKHAPGPGTRQKAGAGWKFIDRAIDKEKPQIIGRFRSRIETARLDD